MSGVLCVCLWGGGVQEKAMVDGMPAEASLAVLAEITAIATAWSWLW